MSVAREMRAVAAGVSHTNKFGLGNYIVALCPFSFGPTLFSRTTASATSGVLSPPSATVRSVLFLSSLNV
ncbi:unnamed protein product [Sphenostylis stenocarpa]|uniref:Uncharacterized protein n=1 Tax=Sphenostylis stenocarpa TaxID=92480 RepID=A0AA86SE54_9FABA|nr:unnamed protein product [Sphenostylis stenocarpa]